MPGQGRLAISRLRVPNLDGFVIAAAGNLLSIRAPRHRCNTVFVKSQYTNQQKPGGKTWGKNLHARVPGQRRLANRTFLSLLLFYIFSICLSKKVTFSSGLMDTPKNRTFVFFFHSILIKKLTLASARSASTGNLQIASTKS